MKITGEIRIYKDDKGRYRMNLTNKELNTQTGEETQVFMKVNVGFKKGLPELKNKALIDVKHGFLTFYRMEEKTDVGRTIYRNYPKIMVMDFETMEEGIDELQPSYQTKKETGEIKNDYSAFVINENEYGDDLPF